MKKEFRKGVKQGLVKRYFKTTLILKWYQYKRKKEKLLVSDAKHFPEALCDFLFEYVHTSVEKWTKIIDAWLTLEQAANDIDSKDWIRYEPGKAKEIFEKLEKMFAEKKK